MTYNRPSPTRPARLQPVILPREAHNISQKLIDPDALKVLSRLQRKGYRSYLCGGGVRDLYLGMVPKDFDVATDARPEQVRKVFRNSRVIGRRFRLAHVFFQSKVIEVSTFRRRNPAYGSHELLIKDDNTFGTPEEDAFRRDFTVNGLFYDIGSRSIIDYVGGLADLEERLIRSIGEPSVRYREDPVRMIRAVKLSSRLGFAIEALDWKAMRDHAEEILKSAAPRLLDELLKILRGGACEIAFRLMEESGLMLVLLPEVWQFLEEARTKETGADFEFYRLLAALDALQSDGRTFDNAVYMAAIFAPWLLPSRGAWTRTALARLTRKVESVRESLATRFALGKRDSQRIRSILLLQHRLKRLPAPGSSVVKRSVFPLALDLCEVRCRSLGRPFPEELASLRAEIPVTKRPARRRRPRRAKGKGDERFAMASATDALPDQATGPRPAPRRRRRRRGRRRSGPGTASPKSS